MRIAAPLLALLILLAGTLPAVAAAGTPASAGSPAASADRSALAAPSPARIESPALTEIHVAPDPGGDARWTVSIRYNLSSETDRAAFDRYGRTFENGDAEVGLDVDFFRTLASEASRTTDREMSIAEPTRNATVRNDTGVLTLSFTWTNFVTDTGEGFVVQDAVFMPGDRTWLTSIGPGQRLVVETPPGYRVTDTRFGLDNGSVVVDGPHTFQEPLTISYQQAAVEEQPQTPWSLIGGAVFVGLFLVAALVYVRRQGDGGDAGSAAATPGETSDRPAPTADAAEAADAGDAADAESAVAAVGDAPAEVDADGDAEGDADVDPSLLSDEERVEYLLDRNGGRMKQARIVRETGWSDAKVSQLLSTMADDGRIEKLRLGRENLISLPDENP